MIKNFKNGGLVLLNLIGFCIVFIGIVFLLNYGDSFLDQIGEKVPWLGKLFGWQKDWSDKV